MIGKEEIDNRFGFHKATIEGDNATLPDHALVRKLFKRFAERLDEILPDGRLHAAGGRLDVDPQGHIRACSAG